MRYTGNLETVHFTNWLLHSGRFDIGELIAEATDNVEENYCEDDFEDDVDRRVALAEALAIVLQCKLDELVGDLFPDSCGCEDLPGFDRKPDPVWLTDDPLSLFGPYVWKGLQKIDFDTAANEILNEHERRKTALQDSFSVVTT